ncbi:MAG: DUF4384 domain-containing protein [Steroidobacteraceae bacterium]|nr:DUF4384 domain-containing protein [Steroidobacteraceae bacterium]
MSAFVIVLSAVAVARAQDPNVMMQQQPLVQQPISPDAVGAGRPSMRLLFAQTLAAAAQSMGSTLVLGLSQALTGSLTAWLERKSRPRVPPVNQSMPGGPVTAPQFFDAQTGQSVAADPSLLQAQTVLPDQAVPPAASTTVDLFAGLAFEVHALNADGSALPVNPATHEFRTGDRFVVFFRPTLPGRMDVFNVNASGVQTQIDTQLIAAGELTRLGPYEFTAGTGDEKLILAITPCTTPELTVATRDIVKVADSSADTVAAGDQRRYGGFQLNACAPITRSLRGLRTRDIRTRDIRKVAIEGTTGFALDAITAQERATGNVAPREVTVILRHR